MTCWSKDTVHYGVGGPWHDRWGSLECPRHQGCGYLLGVCGVAPGVARNTLSGCEA